MNAQAQTRPERWTRDDFERQTKSFLPVLHRAAYRMAGHRMDAEDLVQDTYVKAFRAFSRAELTSADDCRAWMFRILVNTYRDLYRRRARAPFVEPPAGPDGGPSNIVELAVSTELSPAVRAEQQQFVEAAAQVIATLPPEVRVVVTLFFLEGFRYRDIAEATGSPIGTVMSRLSRGRQILRRELKDYERLTPEGGGDAAPQPTRRAQP